MSVAIGVCDLVVVRGSVRAVDGVSFTTQAGVVTGLLGPSGCGKSTLLRSIVGTQIITSGSVSVLGQPAGSPALRKQVGYVTQAPSVYADLSVGENLRFFADVLGADQESIDRALDEVDLVSLTRRTVDQLSGGQRNRVSLAVALLGDPQLLVLDEPTVGLDPVLRRDLWELFGELAAQGRSLLVSSHVMDEAVRCDRLLLMREGRLLADDTPEGILRRTGAASMDEAFLSLVEEARG